MARDSDLLRGLSQFRLALRRFLAASEAISRAGGVTAQQYQVLLAIGAAEGGELAMKDLAEQLLLTPHAAVQMTDRLAAAGLARRRASSEDRRVVFVGLTETGEALLGALAGRHFEELLRQEPQLQRSLRRLRKLEG
jgi:DNA-binding MarR family transcriptional regulator